MHILAVGLDGKFIIIALIGFLVFLGLLGTFWGLLITIDSVGTVITSLGIGDEDSASMFLKLKEGLKEPLNGMGTAFSSSLFGLSGSLILGFLDLHYLKCVKMLPNHFEYSKKYLVK